MGGKGGDDYAAFNNWNPGSASPSSSGGGGGKYSGGKKNVGAWNQGGGKVPSYSRSGATRPDGTTIGSDNKTGNEPAAQPRQGGGIPMRMTPQAKATAKEIGKYATLGLILGGPGGAAIGAGYGAYKGSGTKGGAGELAVDVRGGGGDAAPSLLGDSEEDDR